MSIFKCKMCGGDLDITAGVTVCECEYCGTRQTVPAADNEKKMTLFSRANRLLRGCEFDKAAGVFESIVVDFPEEAEAYWGLVLCKYGIEYVDDPATARKVPTCHRSSFDSVMDDANFEQACENADSAARKVYRDEAKAIEELRKGIIEVSGKEKPYDIFICYKETAENGERTLDSVLAQDVYDALTEKGYRVFFSRVTLEDKLGQEYEPYIFAALNSAKVMLAFGTDYDYYNAVWVKNEWSRFLQLIAKGEKKVLIPCYKGIDAYDLPKEFAKLQAQDMGKVGAMQDLLRGIEKIVNVSGKKDTVAAAMTANNADTLVKRAMMFIEDGEWDNAEAYCEKALDVDPENAGAYVASLMLELKVRRESDLADCGELLDNRNNFQKAMRFADADMKARLKGYTQAIQEKFGEEIYQKAVELAESDDKEKIVEAKNTFESIQRWKDVTEELVQCDEKLQKVADKEASALAKKKKLKKFGIIGGCVVVATVVFLVIFLTVIQPKIKYSQAMELMEAKKYASAYSMLTAMGPYEKNKEVIDKCVYEWLDSSLDENGVAILSKCELQEEQYETFYDKIVAKISVCDGDDYYLCDWGYYEKLLKMLPEDYEHAAAYITFCEAMNGDWDQRMSKLMKIADELWTLDGMSDFLTNDDNIKDFLEGNWSTADGAFYLNFEKKAEGGTHTSYNLPWVAEPAGTKYFNIVDHEYVFADAEMNTLAKVYKFSFTDPNTMAVYCYEDNHTYTLTRH